MICECGELPFCASKMKKKKKTFSFYFLFNEFTTLRHTAVIRNVFFFFWNDVDETNWISESMHLLHLSAIEKERKKLWRRDEIEMKRNIERNELLRLPNQ